MFTIVLEDLPLTKSLLDERGIILYYIISYYVGTDVYIIILPMSSLVEIK